MSLRDTIREYHDGERTKASVSVAVSRALGQGAHRGDVLCVLHEEGFEFEDLSLVIQRHMFTAAQAGRRDASDGVLLACSDHQYVHAYEGYVRTHPGCAEARRRAAQALRKVEERRYL